MNLQIDELIAAAEDYAEKAAELLALEPVRVTIGLEFSKLELINKFTIHYLFPNLSEEERLLVVKAWISAHNSYHIKHWRNQALEQRRKMESSESLLKKLTAIQMEILDSKMFNIAPEQSEPPISPA